MEETKLENKNVDSSNNEVDIEKVKCELANLKAKQKKFKMFGLILLIPVAIVLFVLAIVLAIVFKADQFLTTLFSYPCGLAITGGIVLLVLSSVLFKNRIKDKEKLINESSNIEK